MYWKIYLVDTVAKDSFQSPLSNSYTPYLIHHFNFKEINMKNLKKTVFLITSTLLLAGCQNSNHHLETHL